MDHHWRSAIFATCGEQVDIWDEHRAEPVRSFTWGVDTIHSVKFNPIEVKTKITNPIWWLSSWIEEDLFVKIC